MIKNKIKYLKRMWCFSKFVKKDDLCFDIGAHHGDVSSTFLRLGAKVVAVEPQKKCYDFLKKRFNNKTKIIIINKGVGEIRGSLPIKICEEATTLSTFSEKWNTGRFINYQWNKQEIVNVITLDDLIDEFGLPIFCKIDVEGFELQVLKGLSNPIKYLSFEFTLEFFSDTIKCIKYLQSIGYTKFNFSPEETLRFVNDKWITADKLIEEIKKIDNDLLWGDIYAKY